MRDAQRGYAMQSHGRSGDVHISSVMLVDLLNDIDEIRQAVRTLAEEADERTAKQLEGLAEQINL